MVPVSRTPSVADNLLKSGRALPRAALAAGSQYCHAREPPHDPWRPEQAASRRLMTLRAGPAFQEATRSTLPLSLCLSPRAPFSASTHARCMFQSLVRRVGRDHRFPRCVSSCDRPPSLDSVRVVQARLATFRLQRAASPPQLAGWELSARGLSMIMVGLSDAPAANFWPTGHELGA
jgi:hypothetical protein